MPLSELISALIFERPLCRECIALKTQTSLDEIDAPLKKLAESVRLRVTIDRCQNCGESKLTHRIPRGSGG